MIRAAILGLLMTMTGLPAAHAASEPLAEVDGAAITAEEVETALAPQLTKLEEQVYNLKRQKVEALIAERLLAGEAARRGISVPALFAAEVTSKVGLVSEQESIYAQEIGLDLPAFEQCVSSGRYQAAVQKDIEQGTRAGVAGTPAFFIT